MFEYITRFLVLLYKYYKTETCTLSIRFSPSGEPGDVLVFRYIPIEIAIEIQIDYMRSGTLGHILLGKLCTYRVMKKFVDENGEYIVFGIYLDEEIIPTLSESSTITHYDIKKHNIFLKIVSICIYWKLYEINDSVQ
jgi:hypothetical protein